MTLCITAELCNHHNNLILADFYYIKEVVYPLAVTPTILGVFPFNHVTLNLLQSNLEVFKFLFYLRARNIFHQLFHCPNAYNVQVEAGTRIWFSHVSQSNLNTWALTCCLPRCVLARNSYQECSQYANIGTLIWDVGICLFYVCHDIA